MLEVQGTGVKISRGDTARIVIELDTEPANGTTALITMKRKPQMDFEKMWEKRVTVQDKQIVLELTSEDTNHRAGMYWWDVRLLNGDVVQTLFEPSQFEVLEVVGGV